MKTIRGISVSGWVALGLLASVVFLLSLHALTSIYQDIGRHLTIGELIWESGTIPRTNLFSYTTPDFPFINHHWLGEVLLFLGERIVGLKGLIVVKAVLLTTGFLLAFAAAWRRAVLIPSLGVGLVGIFVIAERTDMRPEILSFLFLGWFLFVLYRKPGTWLIWTLPLTQLFWVNTHIYFFMGPFLFVSWVIGLIAKDGWGIVRRRRIWFLGGAMVATTLANPWFLQGAFYPFSILNNYGYSIVENKTYFFLRHFGYPGVTFGAMIFGLVLYILSVLINRARVRENVMGMVLMGGVTVLGFIMIRNLPLFGLVMMPAILQNLVQSPVRWPERGALMASVLFFLLAVSTSQGQLLSTIGPGRPQFGLIVPQGHQKAVDFFTDSGLKGPIFNNFDIGSYLIWKLPQEKVFIDGRPEAYPAEFIQETYIRAQERADVWVRVKDEYALNAIIWNIRDITPWSRTFLLRLKDDPEWVLVYGDDAIAIFARNNEGNRSIIERLDGSVQ